MSRVTIEPPTVFSGDEVYKLSAFLTKAQWDAISAWSDTIPSQYRSPESGPWLSMWLRTDKVDEYRQAMAEITEDVKRGGQIVYTASDARK
ncbi:MAG: hypothetical protein B7Z66_15550 [Chromatiales bacterium 21-64-14]|nr:MAG: hypothetical protein B7Z66_15550 [Chromatiales bacterium 21-64-14]